MSKVNACSLHLGYSALVGRVQAFVSLINNIEIDLIILEILCHVKIWQQRLRGISISDGERLLVIVYRKPIPAND